MGIPAHFEEPLSAGGRGFPYRRVWRGGPSTRRNKIRDGHPEPYASNGLAGLLSFTRLVGVATKGWGTIRRRPLTATSVGARIGVARCLPGPAPGAGVGGRGFF